MEQTLYRLCDSIMYGLADILGISYEAACVYGNLYFEALLCVVSCLTLFIPFVRRWKRTGILSSYCMHGSGKGNTAAQPKFSNEPGSDCSAWGGL